MLYLTIVYAHKNNFENVIIENIILSVKLNNKLVYQHFTLLVPKYFKSKTESVNYGFWKKPFWSNFGYKS